MTKLLWHSNSPWTSTGYGQQSGLFLPHLKEHYPEIACSAFYGLEGARIRWNGIPILPGIGGNYGDEILVKHAKEFFGGDPRDGLVVTLMDVWVLNPRFLSAVNAAAWVPVDHDPVPPAVVKFFVQSGSVPIAMSRFGERQLAPLQPLYCPHGVDTQVYEPMDRAKARDALGVPRDAFVVGMVAANKGKPSRKCFTQALQAFARLAEKREDAFLFLHTMLDQNTGYGENLPAIIEALGIPSDRIGVPDQYRLMFDPYPPKVMAHIFSSMDVLLNPSMGEGFGIPVLEAQACGTPAIVTDFSAMSEVCGAGWKVKGQRWWTGQDSWQIVPNVDEIAAALEDCYSLSKSARSKLSTSARNHARSYDVRRVMEKFMLPALRAAAKRFETRREQENVPELV